VSDTALEAAISAKLAMKLGFQYLYDNVPVAGFEKTDTKSTVSLVVKL
jgi:putative salt-induced outer membrane protein YdiY